MRAAFALLLSIGCLGAAIAFAQAPAPDPAPAAVGEARATGRDGSPPGGPGTLVRTLVAAIALAGVSFAAGWLLYRTRPPRRSVESALAAAEAARAQGDPRREAEALERAVRSVLAARSPALAGLSPPELEARGDRDEQLMAAAALLANLERDRYGAAARPPDRAAVRAWIAAAIR